MNYIYDILLNFKDEYYDFYDWNKNDNIIHIRKIPIFKISTDDLFNIKNNCIKFDISFLEKINDKTEIFTNKGIKKLNKACLFSDDNTIIGINVVQKKVKISSLLVDEELDSLEDVYTMDTDKIKYTIQNKNKYNEFKTRKQIEMEKNLNNELSNLEDAEVLKYLYYECFDKKENNIDKIKVKLKAINNENILYKLYNCLKLIRVHK